jgi:AcrR family transcriptional regulator
VPIIVDKEQKRRDIALSCRDLLLENGIENLTITKIAQTAGVGKGTIYEYFTNKEDIVFEIISLFLGRYLEELELLITASMRTREKLFTFCYTLFGTPQGQKHLDIYKEFLAISLMRKDTHMLAFSQQTREAFLVILDRILAEGVSRGELEERFAHAAESLIVFSSGLMIESRLEGFDVRAHLEAFLDLLFPDGHTGGVR